MPAPNPVGGRIAVSASPRTLPGARRCEACGRFIAHTAKAVHYFEPDSAFGPEVSEWVHMECLT